MTSMAENNAKPRFVVCVKNDGYLASLEPRKIYPVLRDEKAAKHGLIRVIDESGEDYLYPTDFFAPIEVPKALEKTFALAA